MTSNKAKRTSDTVDFLHNPFDMKKTSSSDVSEVVVSQFIHDLEYTTPASPLKV